MVVVRRRKENKHRGGALVETALVLPILLLVTFGAIKYGWLFLKAQQITNAARYGARMAALPDVTDTDVEVSVINLLAEKNIDANDNDIFIEPCDINGRPAVNCTIIIPTRKVDIMTNSMFPEPVNINASVTMAEEGT